MFTFGLLDHTTVSPFATRITEHNTTMSVADLLQNTLEMLRAEVLIKHFDDVDAIMHADAATAAAAAAGAPAAGSGHPTASDAQALRTTETFVTSVLSQMREGPFPDSKAAVAP